MDIKACPKGSLLHYATEDIYLLLSGENQTLHF